MEGYATDIYLYLYIYIDTRRNWNDVTGAMRDARRYAIIRETRWNWNDVTGARRDFSGTDTIPVSVASSPGPFPVSQCFTLKNWEIMQRRFDRVKRSQLANHVRLSLVRPQAQKRAWYTPSAHALIYPYIYRKIIYKLTTNTWL